MCLSVCVCEKVWKKKKKKSTVHVIIGQRPDRGHAGQAADGRRERDIYLELHLSRLWGGSGIVARPDRVRRGQERETRGGGWGAGSWGLPSWGASEGEEGRYWQIFEGCRCSICRCLIELCCDELVLPPDLHEDNSQQQLRGQRSSPGQNEQPAADAPENV